MDLYVLRHGKAEVFPSAGGKDADRPLTRQGRNEIQQIASWMMKNRCRFTMIATSHLKRAEETAEIVAGVYGLTTSLVVWEELSPGLDFDQLMEHRSRTLAFRMRWQNHLRRGNSRDYTQEGWPGQDWEFLSRSGLRNPGMAPFTPAHAVRSGLINQAVSPESLIP